MHVQLEQVSDLASALQRQVEIQAEAAKQAIHELQEIDSPGSFSSAMDALSLNCLKREAGEIHKDLTSISRRLKRTLLVFSLAR